MALCATDGNMRCFDNEQKRNIAQNIRRRFGRRIWPASADTQQNQKLTIKEVSGISAAVLTAIAIPVFTTQLERSREATDLSNIRAAYAEAVAEYLANGATAQQTATVSSVKQQTAGCDIDDPKLYTRVDGTETPVDLPDIKEGDTATVTVAADGTVTVAKS